MTPELWRHLLPIYLLFVLAFPLGMAWVETRPLTGPTICMFRQLTHLDCPSCGLTRAFRAMGRLQVNEAFGYNPLGPALFTFVTGWWVFCLAAVLSGGRVPVPAWWPRWRRRLFYGFVTLYLLVGFGRLAVEIVDPATRLPTAPGRVTLMFPTMLRK